MEQPRIRLGTHLWQDGRGLPALSPDTARLDDRSLADIAAFLVRYFHQIPIDETRRWDAMLIGDDGRRYNGTMATRSPCAVGKTCDKPAKLGVRRPAVGGRRLHSHDSGGQGSVCRASRLEVPTQCDDDGAVRTVRSSRREP